MIKIQFEGIDDWNRPVFKAVDSRERFGCIHELFNYEATEIEVLNKIGELDLCYFGNSFGCEPMGTNAGNIEIIKSTPKKKKIPPKNNIDKINEAIQLISKAKSLVDVVLGQKEIKDFQFVSNYYAYGRYGINQVLGGGNPLDDSLFSIIKELKKEGL